MIVYLARDIPPFVMYCVNGKLRSSLLIESTDSMIKTLLFLSDAPHFVTTLEKSSYDICIYTMSGHSIEILSNVSNGASKQDVCLPSTGL